MENKLPLSTLKKSYWVSPEPVKVNEDKGNSKANILALIVSCVTSNFPQLIDVKETNFNKFQEELKTILQRELK